MVVVFGHEVGGHQWSAQCIASCLADCGLNSSLLYTDGQLGARVGQIERAARKFDPHLVIGCSDEALIYASVEAAKVERLSILRAYRKCSILLTDLRSHGYRAIVCQTERVTNLLRSSPVGGPPVHTIEPWVEPVTTRVRTCGSPPVVTAVGRDHPVKNLETVMRVADVCPGAQFVICTPVPWSPDRMRGVPGNCTVEVTPSTEDVRRVLARSDLYLTVTQREGLSNVTLDALAHGLPSLLSDADDWAYKAMGAAVVWEAWACNPQSPTHAVTVRQIADAIQHIAEDKELYVRMSQSALDAAARQSYSRYRQGWIHVVRDVVGRTAEVVDEPGMTAR